MKHTPCIQEEYCSSDTKKKLHQTEGSKEESGVKRKHGESDDTTNDGNGNSQQPNKKVKLKGRNKQRPVTFRTDNSKKMCPAILKEEECQFGERCKFCHDISVFMKDKPEDIGQECYNFKTFGRCPYGFACRFASQHLTSDLKNITDQELFDKMSAQPQIHNTLTKDLQHLLWKKKYDFSKANTIVDSYYDKLREEQSRGKQPKSSQDETAASENGDSEKPKGCVLDTEEIRLLHRERKLVSLVSNLQLLTDLGEMCL